MKRVICILLVAALMLGFLAMLSVPAFAATDEIDYDDLVATPGSTEIVTLDVLIEGFLPGQTIPEEPTVYLNSVGVSFDVSWGGEFDSEAPTDTVFQEGKVYYVNLTAHAPEGMTFDTDHFNWNVEGSCYGYSYGFSNDKTQAFIYMEITTEYKWLEDFSVEGLPAKESIGPGAAPAVTVTALIDTVAVTGTKWVAADKETAVTSLEEGNVYYLAVSVQALDVYGFRNWLGIYSEIGSAQSITILNTQTAVAYFRYSMLQEAGELEVTVNAPAEGMAFSELTASVSGNAALKAITVHDAYSGMAVTETAFQANKTYLIAYALQPKAGYEFSYSTGLEVSGTEQSITWNPEPEEISFFIYFSTCPKISSVELVMDPVVPGAKREDIVPTVPDGANYTVTHYYFYDITDHDVGEWDTFQEGHEYELSYQLEPAEGYVFADDCTVTVGGTEARFWSDNGGIYGNGWIQYAFTVSEVRLWNAPYEIYPGEPEEIGVTATEDQVKLVSAQWVDADKQPVTAFQEGKAYYLAVTLEAQGSRKFTEAPQLRVDYNEHPFEFEKVSDKQAVIYLRYSLEPLVERVNMTVSGLEKGAKLEDVTASVTAGAEVAEITVLKAVYDAQYDGFSYVPVEETTFQDSTTYVIRVKLTAQEGYRINGGTDIYAGDKLMDMWNRGTDYVEVQAFFTTCKKITSASLTVKTAKVGIKIEDMTPTVPSGANYTVISRIYDETDGYQLVESGTLQKGHRYNHYIKLVPNDGYVFDTDMTVELNGKVTNFYVSASGVYADESVSYSFLEKITKIELPAMPGSIKKGDTLSADYTVSSGKNYTLEASWRLYGGDNVTKVENDGVYVLMFYVYPKTGYEFAEDAKITVGGKTVSQGSFHVSEGYAAVRKSYNIGMEEIGKVQLSVPTLEAGKAPGTITVTGGGHYELADSAWGASTSGDLYEDIEIVTTLENGKFIYMGVLLGTEEGYIFADDCVFYVNGKKVTPTLVQNDYQQVVAYLPMGKLGEIEKLTAPKVEKDGEVLTWDAVMNADGYEIYRATKKSGKYTKVATVTDTTWQDSAAAKTYYYKVKAIYSADTSKSSGYSGVVSVVYKCDAPEISVENNDAGKPVLSWEKVAGAKKYTVYRATSETGKYKKLGTTTKLSYTDSKASAGTVCYYKVVANASKSTYNSGYSNVVSCGVICGTPKVTVKLDTATGKPVLSWSKVSGAVGYEIYLLGAEEYVPLGTVTKTTFTDSSCAVGEGRYYGVRAIAADAINNSEVSEAVFAKGTCAQPALKGGTNAYGQPRFNWQIVEGAVKYNVYRSTKSSKGFTLIATVEDGNAYTDETASVGKTYYYKVEAVGEGDVKSAMSGYVKLTGKCATPVAAAQQDEKSGRPIITWEKISGAKKYTVYRATAVDGKYKKLGTTTKLSYTDTKASVGKTYYYKVVANASSSKNNSGYSEATAGVTAILAQPKITVKNDSKTGAPVVSWSKVSGAKRYMVMYMAAFPDSFVDPETPYEVAYTTKTSYTIEGLSVDELCKIQVVAVAADEQFNSQPSEEKSIQVLPGTPKVTGKVGANGKPVIGWETVDGAIGYQIYRSTKKSSGYVLIGEVEDMEESGEFVPAYEDTTAKKGKTYYYKVVAKSWWSSSPMSGYVKVKSK